MRGIEPDGHEADLLAEVERSGSAIRLVLFSFDPDQPLDGEAHEKACRAALDRAGADDRLFSSGSETVTVEDFYGWTYDRGSLRLALPSLEHGFRGPGDPDLAFSPGLGPFVWWTASGGGAPFHLRRTPRPGFGFAWSFVEAIRLPPEQTVELFHRVVEDLLGSPDRDSEILRWRISGDDSAGDRYAFTLRTSQERLLVALSALPLSSGR